MAYRRKMSSAYQRISENKMAGMASAASAAKKAAIWHLSKAYQARNGISEICGVISAGIEKWHQAAPWHGGHQRHHRRNKSMA
jgi:hypothetical protein